MDVGVFMQYVTDYGWIAIFVIVLLEYLNLPGFPAGVIMPFAGLWAAQGNINFAWTTIVRAESNSKTSWIGKRGSVCGKGRE